MKMKRFLVLMLLCLPLFGMAQNSNMQAKFEASLPDSVKYVLPAFKNGRVVYKNGEFSPGVFNISTLDQSLRFMQDGQELSVADIDEVDRVSIGGMLFLRQQNGFFGIVDQAGDVCLCVERRIVFDDTKVVYYDYELLEDLEHAYAVTIHKAQGSEYPAVVIPLLRGPRMLMNRNLLYTGVTRAINCVTILGDEGALHTMVDNVEEMKRYTGLCRCLREHTGR